VDRNLEHPDGTVLAAYWARPATGGAGPGLVLVHDFPTPPRGSLASGLTFPELADRIALHAGWRVLTFNFRGTGGSSGGFSVGGWRSDLQFAVDEVAGAPDVSGVWIAGTGVGGSLALAVGAEDERVRGIAALGAPVDVRDWARDPARFLRHCRAMGVLDPDAEPADPNAWARELAAVDAVDAASRFGPRPLLVVHGTDDDVVPVTDAQRLADAHGNAELRIVMNAGRRLRHDPRAVASLLGWLDRQVV